jgi:hypothetical protein
MEHFAGPDVSVNETSFCIVRAFPAERSALAVPPCLLGVRPSGAKTYYQRYGRTSRERQFKIGPADVLTLRQAKRKALQIKAEAILGGDVNCVDQFRRYGASLMSNIFRLSKATREVGRPTRRLRIHVLPELGRYFLDEIRPDFILSVTNKMRGEHYASGSVAQVIIILRYPLGSDALRTTALSKRHPVLIAAL